MNMSSESKICCATLTIEHARCSEPLPSASAMVIENQIDKFDSTLVNWSGEHILGREASCTTLTEDLGLFLPKWDP